MSTNKEIVLFRAPDGTISLDVRLQGETVWLSLNQMANLFGRDKSVVSRHLGNVFKTKELERSATVASFATVQREGGRQVERQVEHFNLDAIISVGYRVNSRRGAKCVADATLVALTLLIAESKPAEKEVMVTVIVNLINRRPG